MKTSITIFVSGSKKLKEHRLRLKALVNNLNGENRLKGHTVTLNMFSYVNLGDNQSDYDDFIRDKSDIVMFIIEDKMGDKTKEEFLLASEAHKKKGHPKLFVFIKDYAEKTPEMEEVEQLVNDNTDSYYVEYANLEDLEFKVRERLMQEVNGILEGTSSSPKKKIKMLRIGFCVTLLASLFLLAHLLFNLKKSSDDVTLVLVGGGSALNCLQEYENVGSLYDYENAINLSVPTKTSWPIISGEAIHRHALREDTRSKLFYPIALSAMAAVDSNFLMMSNKDQFMSKCAVLALHIGDDSLFIYVKKGYQNELIDGKKSINVRDLAAFLRDVSTQDFMIFTTDEGSGTLTYYQKSLAPYHLTISKAALGDKVARFTDMTPESKIRRDETPYVMLGSRYYVAEEVYKSGDCRPIYVETEDGEALIKPIYLYFAGYYKSETDSYWIPDEMVDLLVKIDPRFKKVIKDNLIPRENERLIVHLNDYLDRIQ